MQTFVQLLKHPRYKSEPRQEMSMLRNCPTKKSMIVAGCLIFATVLAGQGTLKEHIGAETHWLTILIPLAVAMIALHGRKVGDIFLRTVREQFLIALPWAMLIVAILIAAVTSDLGRQEIRFSIVTCVKLAALVVCLYALLSLRPTGKMLEIALKVLLTATVLAFAISLVVPELPVRFDNRMGWFGAANGVFWKSGIFLMPLLVYKCLTSKDFSAWLWLALASTVVALDGTRTGLLLEGIILVSVFCFCGLSMSFQSKGLWPRFMFAVSVIIIVHLFIQPFIFYVVRGSIMEHVLVSCLLIGFLVLAWLINYAKLPYFSIRLNLLVSTRAWAKSFFLVLASLLALGFGAYLISSSLNLSSSSLMFSRSLTEDAARMEQLPVVLDGIRENFLLGGGLGTARTERYHVHMVYLQLLADIGILGLLAYISVFLIVLGKPSRLYGIYRHDEDRLIIGAGVVLVYIASGAFHPFSNEISEWFIVLFAFAVLLSAPTKAVPVRSEAPAK